MLLFRCCASMLQLLLLLLLRLLLLLLLRAPPLDDVLQLERKLVILGLQANTEILSCCFQCKTLGACVVAVYIDELISVRAD